MTAETAVAVEVPGVMTDADRLGALFDAHHQRLYRLARRLSRTPEDGRDLVQETFLRAARAPGSIPAGAGSDEAWLVRVLVNLARDRWRQRARRERLHVHEAIDPPPAADPESALVARSVIWHALDALSPRRRAVLVMYELEGVGIDVIARTLGLTRVTVRWHLSIGRRQMAKTIAGRGTES